MAIPERVDAWTFDTIQEVVIKHDCEPGEYDYFDEHVVDSLHVDNVPV